MPIIKFGIFIVLYCESLNILLFSHSIITDSLISMLCEIIKGKKKVMFSVSAVQLEVLCTQNIIMYLCLFKLRFLKYHVIPGVTCEAGTSYPSGILELTPGLIGVRIALSLVLCVLFCSFCVIALSVLLFTVSDYHFGIFNFSW